MYDRQWDWVLTGPGDGKTRIIPQSQSPLAAAFAWESRGFKFVPHICPLYYQKHRNLRYFQPWTYKVRKDSITGWCSWWAYLQKFTQADLEKVVDVMAKNRLADFGYRFIQIDDTYQGGSGTPDSWLKWNNKFPGGIEKYAETVKAGGFEPGDGSHPSSTTKKWLAIILTGLSRSRTANPDAAPG